jgi:nucleoside-diphosphate-sugar epimerase
MLSYQGVPVAVLGASGFIGRWVARKLGEAGARPWVVVRDARAGRDVLEQCGIRGQVVEADLADDAAVADLYRRIRPSITFNLVGYGVDPSERDDRLAHRINADLPRVLCEAVASAKDGAWPGQHLVHAGTAAEYGDAGGTLPENGPATPSTLYGISKLAGTRAVAESAAALGIRALAVRLFTVYGPGEHAGRLLPSLIEAGATGRPLDLTAGLQRRDFTYVEDVAEGLLRLGLTPNDDYQVVNLATGQLTTVRGFVETAAYILAIRPGNLRFGAIPTRSGEMEHDPVSFDRLRRLAAWTPPVTIAEGIRKSVEIGVLKRTP